MVPLMLDLKSYFANFTFTLVIYVHDCYSNLEHAPRLCCS